MDTLTHRDLTNILPKLFKEKERIPYLKAWTRSSLYDFMVSKKYLNENYPILLNGEIVKDFCYLEKGLMYPFNDTPEDSEIFISNCVKLIGDAFFPERLFETYKLFNEEECLHLNTHMDLILNTHHLDLIYYWIFKERASWGNTKL